MGIPNRTCVYMGTEGIIKVWDLKDPKDSEWDAFASISRHPPRIPSTADPAILIHQLPFVIPVKSLQRLKTASVLIHHYHHTN